MAANDGIRRGDSERTGDLEARRPDDVGRTGSGVRASDDGPAGIPTGDVGAGEFVPDVEYLSMDEADGVGDSTASTSDLEDLTIVSADDPSLGLTGTDEVPADDWAADVGPTRNPDRGLTTDDLSDDRSTLAPDR